MVKYLVVFCLFFISFSTLLFSQIDGNYVDRKYTVYYYPNGQISSEGFLKNNLPVGLWKAYYPDGVLKSCGLRTNGELDSIWVFYNEFGRIKNQINYFNGKKNGFYYTYVTESFYDSSKVYYLYSKEMYLNNIKHGLSEFYYANGNKNFSIIYKNGLKEGITKEYNSDGNLITIIEYRNGIEIDRNNVNRYQDSVKVGDWMEFYANGKLKYEYSYINGLLHGLYKEYDINGELINTKRFELGVLKDAEVNIENEINIVEEFYDVKNEKGEYLKKSSGSFANGHPVGVHRTYDSTGRVNSSKSYDDKGNLIAWGIVNEEGDKVGSWEYYYESGKVKSKGNFANNRRVGVWTYYYENGSVEQSGSFSRGVPSGNWKWFYENGALKAEEVYKNGKEEGEAIEYDEYGAIISQGFYSEGLKEGKWFFNYYSHTEEGEFRNDLKEGIWRYKYSNSKLYFEGNFLQGYADGKHIFYEMNGKILEIRNYSFGIKSGNWEYYAKDGSLMRTEFYEKGVLVRIDGVTLDINNTD